MVGVGDAVTEVGLFLSGAFVWAECSQGGSCHGWIFVSE